MIKAKKSLSQNFLIDQNICNKIVDLTKIHNKLILEIGPGFGIMTDIILSRKPKKLILIEKDFNLAKILETKYKDNKNIILISGDVLKFDFSNLKNLTVISNLPYNVSTNIILYLFTFNKNINEMIFMIQKEVSQKFDYNLPIMNKYKFYTKITSKFKRCFNVNSNVFKPKPKVKSTVVKFILNHNNLDFYKLNVFCNLIFKNIRKKIYNNLKVKNNDQLLDKRVNQLSIEELLRIYNSF